jgi:hypothetical protein
VVLGSIRFERIKSSSTSAHRNATKTKKCGYTFAREFLKDLWTLKAYWVKILRWLKNMPLVICPTNRTVTVRGLEESIGHELTEISKSQFQNFLDLRGSHLRN